MKRSGGDDELEGLGHGQLVALLNSLYASASEPGLPPSTARASTDEELRAAIRTVRSRLGSKTLASKPETRQLAANPRAPRPRRSDPSTAEERPRFLCVLFTSNRGLVSRARTLLRARSIPTVAVDSSAALIALLDQAMPTHLVIDASCGALADVMKALGSRARAFSIVQGSTESAVLAAVAAIADL